MLTVLAARAVRTALAVPVVLGLLMAGAGCSSEEEADPSAARDGSSESGHGGDGVYGSSMGPEIVSVAEVADLGAGPQVGDSWSGDVGLNVCGRFLDPPAAVGPPVAGFSTDGSGRFTLAPTTAEQSGHAATVGSLAALVGITMGTGTMTLPPSTTPARVDLDEGPVEVAGSTLNTGQDCGPAQATVQLWIYTPDAAASGEDVRVVVTDPQDVPVVEDGMTFVFALTPTSSLPTLPPSALVG
jgi:hypothetical protein